MKKVAIVGYEGGVSCAYFVGVILALVEKFNLTHPYLVIGSSGSTGTLAYYVAGQYESIRKIFGKKFFFFKKYFFFFFFLFFIFFFFFFF